MENRTYYKIASELTSDQLALGRKDIVKLLKRKSLPQPVINEFLQEYDLLSLYDELRQINLRSSLASLKNFGNTLRDDNWPVDFDLTVDGIVQTFKIVWFNYMPLAYDYDFDWDNDYDNIAPLATAIALLTFSDKAHVIFPVAELHLGNIPLDFSVVWHLEQQKFWIVNLHYEYGVDSKKPAVRFGKLPNTDVEFSFGVLEGLDVRDRRQATLTEHTKEGWSLWPMLRIGGVNQISPAALNGINAGIRAGTIIPEHH